MFQTRALRTGVVARLIGNTGGHRGPPLRRNPLVDVGACATLALPCQGGWLAARRDGRVVFALNRVCLPHPTRLPYVCARSVSPSVFRQSRKTPPSSEGGKAQTPLLKGVDGNAVGGIRHETYVCERIPPSFGFACPPPFDKGGFFARFRWFVNGTDESVPYDITHCLT